MALIKCPECGKENVSDTAVSCPGCGYNIQAHMKKMQQQEKLQEKNERIKQQEHIRNERNNDPAYKKRIMKTILAVCVAVVLIICAVVFGSKYKAEKAYEKDLSSVFGISINSTMDDIIAFEASEYGHTEYNTEIVQDGKMTRLEFAPYSMEDGIRYKHMYFFYTSTEILKEIDYRDIIGSMRNDNDSKCSHVKAIKNAVLSISSNWDKSESDDLFLTMYGNINGTKCRVRYQGGSEQAISLFIDREY